MLSQATVGVDVLELGDVLGEPLRPGGRNLPQPARWVDRTGIVHSDGQGSVTVATDAIRALFPYALQAQVVNSGAVSGTAVTRTVAVLGVTRSTGTGAPFAATAVPIAATCSSSNAAVATAGISCASVTFATVGLPAPAADVDIVVARSGLTAKLRFHVETRECIVTLRLLRRPVCHLTLRKA